MVEWSKSARLLLEEEAPRPPREKASSWSGIQPGRTLDE